VPGAGVSAFLLDCHPEAETQSGDNDVALDHLRVHGCVLLPAVTDAFVPG
jgi:hypothetical protein